ncbi:Ig-like domain-containing protein, partial [Buttiauxella gaviniae]|uniref:Ig-like domain-containing protein n=1 Tax=Buttiauxella gaviniae TaxID=82990 RepID=UPI000AA3DD62
TPILSGTTEPDSTITISDNGTVIGTFLVDGTGIWSYAPTALGEGSHSFTVTATDAVGNVSTVSNTYTVIVDTTPPAVPVIDAADDNVGDLQQPVLSGGITDDTTPTFHGTGVDGDIIKLYNGSTLLGTTTVVGGVWSITPTPALP